MSAKALIDNIPIYSILVFLDCRSRVLLASSTCRSISQLCQYGGKDDETFYNWLIYRLAVECCLYVPQSLRITDPVSSCRARLIRYFPDRNAALKGAQDTPTGMIVRGWLCTRTTLLTDCIPPRITSSNVVPLGFHSTSKGKVVGRFLLSGGRCRGVTMDGHASVDDIYLNPRSPVRRITIDFINGKSGSILLHGDGRHTALAEILGNITEEWYRASRIISPEKIRRRHVEYRITSLSDGSPEPEISPWMPLEASVLPYGDYIETSGFDHHLIEFNLSDTEGRVLSRLCIVCLTTANTDLSDDDPKSTILTDMFAVKQCLAALQRPNVKYIPYHLSPLTRRLRYVWQQQQQPSSKCVVIGCVAGLSDSTSLWRTLSFTEACCRHLHNYWRHSSSTTKALQSSPSTSKSAMLTPSLNEQFCSSSTLPIIYFLLVP